MRELWVAAAGVAIALWTLREVFKDLFQPTGSGALSSWIGRSFFALGHRFPPVIRLAGPLTIVAVIGCWIFLILVSFYAHLSTPERERIQDCEKTSRTFRPLQRVVGIELWQYREHLAIAHE